MLDTRTKHTIAQDRLIVAEHRTLEAERRKSFNAIQLLSFEQKQLEKRLTTIYNKYQSTIMDRPLKIRGRSTSEIILRNRRRTSSWTDVFPMRHSKMSISLQDTKQNLLTLPKMNDENRRYSAYSDGDVTEHVFFHLESESSGEDDDKEKISRSNSKLHTVEKVSMMKKKSPQGGYGSTKALPPIVAVIPPDEDILVLRQ